MGRMTRPQMRAVPRFYMGRDNGPSFGEAEAVASPNLASAPLFFPLKTASHIKHLAVFLQESEVEPLQMDWKSLAKQDRSLSCVAISLGERSITLLLPS